MEQVFLSLGSNLGDRIGNLQEAIKRLRECGTITTISHAYESEPVEFTAQPWFVNAVVGLRVEETGEAHEHLRERSSPEALLERLLTIEAAMGRRRDEAAYIPKGPRIIDIDIVLYGGRVIHTASLTVPHPAMHLRRFVLQPLAEIAPDVEHPLLHQSAEEMLRALSGGGPVVRVLAPLITEQ